MNVVIAGGRDYHLTKKDIAWLDRLHAKYNFQHVISGCCRGADEESAKWFRSKGNFPSVWEYPADWQHYGKQAGPMRNKAMARSADLVILFPGGRGTMSMAIEARLAGKRIIWAHGNPADIQEPDHDDE